MHILVTGGAGFVGTNLVNKLIKDGHRVTIIDNFSTGKRKNINSAAYCWEQDIATVDIDTLYEYVNNADLVFHMAAMARIQPSFERPSDYIETNFTGTYNLVRACDHANVPLIYAGSSSHHSGKFKNPYTFSKDMGEDVIKLYQEHFELKASVARFYNVYGPHQLTEGGYTTLIGRWLNNIENDIQCKIYGDGEKRRDFTHVDDIVDGLIRIMKQQAYGHTFEFGRGKNYSVNEVAKMFKILPEYQPDKPGEAQDTLADNIFACDMLAWEPKINLIDYIKNQIK
jgi:UDP-glucose 4-epimerase